MTRYAIIADTHARLDRLKAVLHHANSQGATAVIDLGDTGSDPCHSLLRRVGAQAVFGNYEVTGWGSLQPENQLLVRALQPVLIGETFLAAHATPCLPANLRDLDNVLEYLVKNNVSWQSLFPRLNKDEGARQSAYAKLEEQDRRVFFHGHTHVQAAWRIDPSGAMSALRGKSFALEGRGRYLVGVGSVGQPEDGSAPRYTIYDEATMTVFPICLA